MLHASTVHGTFFCTRDNAWCDHTIYNLPGSAWADGILTEMAEQVSKMVEHLGSKSTQPNYPLPDTDGGLGRGARWLTTVDDFSGRK